jgi:hypothetical protein
MNSAEVLQILSKEWNTLRETPGHWNGQPFNAEVDAPQGRKKQVMDVLFSSLKNEKDATKVISVLGNPDNVVQKLPGVSNEPNAVPLMPGPIVASGSSESTDETKEFYYLIYQWRNKHDYLWFKISADEQVVASDWYHAYE